MNKDINNYSICQQALKLKDNIEGAYLKLGELLYNIRDKRLYSPMHDTFPEFLMEMDMTEGTASKMITVYTKLVEEYQIPPEEIIKAKGWSKAYLVSKNSDTREQALEYLYLAQIQPRTHLIATIQEKTTGLNIDDCSHEFRTLKICKKCNYKYEEF